MSERLKKGLPAGLDRQDGFALVTAIMLLFVAMILGLMVVNSSDMEIMLSGAQQRYEESLNTAEGGTGAEAAAVGNGLPINRIGNSRSYSVVNPSVRDQVLSPDNPATDPLFDPGDDMPDPAAPYIVGPGTTTSP
jgi:hypothetical protein